jgi:hypothetical protein
MLTLVQTYRHLCNKEWINCSGERCACVLSDCRVCEINAMDASDRTDPSFVDEIFACSLSGDVILLQSLVLRDMVNNIHWMHCRSKCGDTPLHVSARRGNLELVR